MRSKARTSACALGVFMLMSVCLGTEAAAAVTCGPESNVPCTFGITEPGIQLSNGAIKFQARVSQGKIPVSDGEISQVTVELVDGASKVMCTQTFGKVAVRNSILNLDFQPSGCALDNVVAKTSDLAFKLVLAGSALKPIPIGTVPYALKSNYAVKAQETHKADVAAQAHYAHRITADRQTLATPEIGTGYFDFFTPASGGNLYDDTLYQQSYLNDGFIQWTPVQGQSSLHVCAKGVNDDKLAKLEALYLESKVTTAHGTVVVDPPQAAGTPPVALTVKSGGASVTGYTSLNSGAVVSGGLLVTDSYLGAEADLICKGDAKVDMKLTVGGDETVGGELSVKGNATVDGVVTVGGDESVKGHFAVSRGAEVNGGIAITDSAPTGTTPLICRGNARLEKDLTVLGAETIEGGLTVKSGGASVTGYTSLNSGAVVSGGLLVTDSTLSGDADLICKGDAQVDKKLAVGGDETVGGELSVKGNASVDGVVTVGGDESVKGHFTVSRGAEVNGGLAIGDSAPAGTAPLICRGNTRLEKDLTVVGAGIIEGGLTANRANVNGDLTVTSPGSFVCAGNASFGSSSVAGGGAAVDFYSAVNFRGPVSLSQPLTNAIPASGVQTGSIADQAVTTDKIASEAVKSDKIGVLTGDVTRPALQATVVGGFDHTYTPAANIASALRLNASKRDVAGLTVTTEAIYDTASWGYQLGVFSCVGSLDRCQNQAPEGTTGEPASAAVVAVETSFGTRLNDNYGVYASSVYGKGVYASGQIGVQGSSSWGTGVYGLSTDGNGVSGNSKNGYGGRFSSGGTRAPLHVEPLLSGQALPLAANSSKGDIVVHSDGTLYFFNGTVWKQVTVQ